MTQCYFCGSKSDIEKHHILPQRFEGSDAETNVVDLCHDCHWKLERLYNKDFWEAIGVEDPRATKESHVRCEYHGCTNPAIGKFDTSSDSVLRIKGGTSSQKFYRCAKHKPKNDGSDLVSTKENQQESIVDPGRPAAHLDFGFNELIGQHPVSKSEIKDIIKSSDVDEIEFMSEDNTQITHLRLKYRGYRYQVKFEHGEWDVWPSE